MTNSDKSYLIYMAIRLLEMKRLLKSTGSIYLHCDPTMSHYLKLVMDAIFGKENYRAEIIWNRQSSHNDKLYGATHETIFYYSHGEKTIPNEVLIPLKDKRKKAFNKSDKHGKYEADNLKGSRSSSGESGQPLRGIDPEHRHWAPPRVGSRGRYAEYIVENFIPNYADIKGVHARLDALDEAGLIIWSSNGYLMLDAGMPPQSIWNDIEPCKGKESKKYPTQKPVALLDCIKQFSVLKLQF